MKLIKRIATRILGIGSSKPEDTVVGSVIDRLVPDIHMKKKIMLGIKEEYAKHEIEIDNMLLEDVQSARDMYIIELQQLKGKVINFVRAIVRPYLSIMAGTIWGYTIVQRIITKSTPLMTPWDYSLIGMVMAFYFGARYLEKGKLFKGK